jgi:D-aspartate ligase
VLPPVVVVGQASLVGLQTARTFADRGIEVIGVVGDRDHFAARTRVCSRQIISDVFSDQLLDDLEALGDSLSGRAVLVPCTDNSALRISKSRDRLERWYDLPLGPYASLLELADKAQFARSAERAGLDIPTTVIVDRPEAAERAAGRLSFPLVLKPALKSAVWTERAGGKALIVEDRDALLRQYERLRPWTSPLVVQEFVGGGDDALFTVNGFFAGGEPLVTFSTRKLRQWPPRTGTASFAREERNDELVAAATAIFSDPAFTGLGYLEAKQDPGTGRLKLIEANVGRPTGRSVTAEAGGVELLQTMYCHAAGLPLPDQELRQQRYVGAGWLDLRRDLLAGAHLMRRHEMSLSRLLADWSRPRTAHAVWSWRDPMPFLAETSTSLVRAATRRLTR